MRKKSRNTESGACAGRADCGVCKSAVSDAIHRVEDTPVKDGTFRLPGKKAPRRKTAEAGLSGGGLDGESRTEAGKTAETVLFRESIGRRIDPEPGVDVDCGYEEIQAFHEKSRVTGRAGKGHPLGRREKDRNRRIGRRRIVTKDVNAVIKVFRIFAYPYRNHLRRHLPRMPLVCGIINFGHRLRS